ncbi:MAG: pyrroline-5-carboxylate reductase [Chlamydiota bacterium]
MLGVIGLGVMGKAIISGAVERDYVNAEEVLVAEKHTEYRQKIERDYGYRCLSAMVELSQCEAIIVAVKPQDFKEVLAQIEPWVSDNHLLISIAAGITTGAIDKALHNKGRLVRVMPNTPVLVSQGVSAVCRGSRATDKDITYVKRLFGALGIVKEISESDIDLVAALSGSGPAYFFSFIEAMVEAAVSQGVDKHLARELVVETCGGAYSLLRSQDKDPATLRREVTSSKGSTAEALKIFQSGQLKALVADAINAAVKRNRELGQTKV